jgi:hypothetical protein
MNFLSGGQALPIYPHVAPPEKLRRMSRNSERLTEKWGSKSKHSLFFPYLLSVFFNHRRQTGWSSSIPRGKGHQKLRSGDFLTVSGVRMLVIRNFASVTCLRTLVSGDFLAVSRNSRFVCLNSTNASRNSKDVSRNSTNVSSDFLNVSPDFLDVSAGRLRLGKSCVE